MTVDLHADFDQARRLLEQDLPRYSAWARDNCGAKAGGSVDNPTVESELGRWVRFRTQLLAGTRPDPPVMGTKIGRALVAVGTLYLDAAAPVAPPAPKLHVTVTGAAIQGGKLTAAIGAA